MEKLHLGVDRPGVIVAQALTDGNFNDAKTGLALIDNVVGDVESLTADSAYDTLAIYAASAARGADVVVPPSRSATRSRQPRSRSGIGNSVLQDFVWVDFRVSRATTGSRDRYCHLRSVASTSPDMTS